jgi:hypothetical protein
VDGIPPDASHRRSVAGRCLLSGYRSS